MLFALDHNVESCQKSRVVLLFVPFDTVWINTHRWDDQEYENPFYHGNHVVPDTAWQHDKKGTCCKKYNRPVTGYGFLFIQNEFVLSIIYSLESVVTLESFRKELEPVLRIHVKPRVCIVLYCICSSTRNVLKITCGNLYPLECLFIKRVNGKKKSHVLL